MVKLIGSKPQLEQLAIALLQTVEFGVNGGTLANEPYQFALAEHLSNRVFGHTRNFTLRNC